MSSKETVSILDGKILLIKPKEQETSTVPVYCACCQFPMLTMEDSLSFRKVGVCYRCDAQWTNYKGISLADKESWPKKDSPEWAEYIEIRALYARPILNLK